MKITIPIKTPSVNHIYFTWKNRRILTKEARSLKEDIQVFLDEQVDYSDFLNFKEKELRVTVDVYENWYTKKGTVARKDVSNREKWLIDTVFKILGLNDKFIFNHKMNKVQSTTEKTIINIEIIGEKEVINLE